MLSDKLKKYNIILGSSSPRRKQLLSEMGLSFKIINTNKKEKFPKELKEQQIVEFLAKQKANYLTNKLIHNYLLITADTIVLLNKLLLNKPQNKINAFNMLSKLSGNTHKVITGVCIKT